MAGAVDAEAAVASPGPGHEAPVGEAGSHGSALMAPRRARKRPPGRPTTEESDLLRQAVLASGLQVFVRRGFEAASIDAIARSAKVARITIYRQFTDKEGLFREVVGVAQDTLQRRLEAAVNTEGSPPEVLRRILAGLHETMTHPDYLNVLRLVVGEAPRFPEIARLMESKVDHALRPVVDYLAQLHRRGVIVDESPRATALQMATLAAGGMRYLMRRPSGSAAGRAHWVESLYRLFAHHWGLLDVPAPTTSRTPSPVP